MNKVIYLLLILLLAACSDPAITVDDERNEAAPIFPDYADCTIPVNIAPLNFKLTVPYDEARVRFTSKDGEWSIKAKKGQFTIPAARWTKMLEDNVGNTISVKVIAKIDNKWVGYSPFNLNIALEPVDPYIAYRLIEPGYELWFHMGIYQRNIEKYDQSPILENKQTNGSCMNCHSFRMQDPDDMVFHLRGPVACTILTDGDKVEKLNTKTEQTMSALVYPSWHPSGRYVAFSVNETEQAVHMHDPNRLEYFDNKSDVVVYDTQKHEIITSHLLYGDDAFEIYPTFSPDGKTLYFSSAERVDSVITNFKDVQYHLCSISFDPDNRVFGTKVDTLFNAHIEKKSTSLPRVSPDGKYMMLTLTDFGGYSIWHKGADLCLIDLSTGERKSMDKANSDNVDSYHSWSSNSRWVVFSSRRIDGLYTRPYIAYINENGEAEKAFLLPQKDVDFYHRFVYAYNIPEFIKGKVKDKRRFISNMAKNEEGINVTFGGVQ